MLVMTESLASWLDRRIAAKKNTTQNAVALYVGVSHSAISEWRKGNRIPDPPYCWKLAEYFDTPIEEVMRLAGHLPPEAPALREDRFEYDAEVLGALRRLTPDEQREAALPAIELAEALLKRGRGEAEE